MANPKRQSKVDFWKDWDVEQTFVPALRKSGFRFSLSKLATGTYRLSIEDQPFSDLSVLRARPSVNSGLTVARFATSRRFKTSPCAFGFVRQSGGGFDSFAQDATPRIVPRRNSSERPLPAHGAAVGEALSPRLRKAHSSKCSGKNPDLGKTHLAAAGPKRRKAPRALPNLKWLAFAADQDSAHFPATTAEQFWKGFRTLKWVRAVNKQATRPTGTSNGCTTAPGM